MNPDYRPPATEQSEDSIRRLLAAVKPDVAPLAAADSAQILACAFRRSGSRSLAWRRPRYAVVWAPAAVFCVLVLPFVANPSGDHPITPLGPVRKVIRTGAPPLAGDVVSPLPARTHPRIASHVGRTRMHRKRGALFVRSGAKSQPAGSPAAVPVEFIATPILFDSGDFLASIEPSGETGPLSSIDVSVSNGKQQAGSANTVAFDTGVDGGVVENSCTVSGTGSSDRIVATTSSAGEESSLLLSVEWAGDAAAGQEENEP